MKTLILVNTLTSVNSFVYANHIEFMVYTKSKYKDKIVFFTPNRMSIDTARNSAAVLAHDYKCTHLMFIDDDVLVPKDAFERLYKADKDIIAGLNFNRAYPFQPMVMVEKKREMVNGQKIIELKHIDPPLNKLTECYAIGFSCALIKMDVLKALDPPFFVTGTHQTEDVYFCCKAKQELRPQPKVFVDGSVQCGHCMSPEFVSAYNVKKFRKFYTPPKGAGGERVENYLDACLKSL